MQRIVILGCSGTGKSTLARRVGERLGLPVIHLDRLFWEPGWVQAETDAFRARVAAAIAAERWVTDGLYSSKTFDLRLPRADAVIWLDQPRWLRIWRVTARKLRNWGRVPSDLGEDCPERWDDETWPFYRYIWDFDAKTRPRVEASLAALRPDLPVIRLRGDRAIAAWLASLT